MPRSCSNMKRQLVLVLLILLVIWSLLVGFFVRVLHRVCLLHGSRIAFYRLHPVAVAVSTPPRWYHGMGPWRGAKDLQPTPCL